MLSVTAAVWSAMPLFSQGTLVTDAFVEAVAQIESGGDSQAKGDSGKAAGRWQMHEAAWADITAYRLRKGWQVWPYEQAQDASVARIYARDYLTMLEDRLRNVLGDQVTVEMIYAAYNMGFGNFRKREFLIENSPAATRAACLRVSQLLVSLEKSKAVPDLAKAD
jgi:hypothetical protein